MNVSNFKDSFNLQKPKGGNNMRLLIKDRAKGKTTQMIYTSEATGYPIVVETQMQKNFIMNKAKEMSIVIPEPITLNEIKNMNNIRGRIRVNDKVIIDEGYNIIEKALKAYIGCDVMAVTLTDKIKEHAQF